MQLLISDANILIDLEEGDLLNALFRLPYRFSVPDILFYEELEEQHPHLRQMGLRLLELTPSSMRYAFDLIQRTRGPSRNDCFALALAYQEQCPLLSGDQALRKAAEREAIEVRGTLWIVETLISHRIISVEGARAAYNRMKNNARRLPWDLAFKRLAQLASGTTQPNELE